MRHLRFPAVLVPSLMLVLASCAAATPTPEASVAGGATTIDVTLQEWAVVPSQATAPAGEITFVVTNDGPDDIHEFVVLKTDLDPSALPTAADGSVDETGEGIEVIGEIEDIAVGTTMDVSVTLDAGSYVLACNIYTAAEDEAHYAMGMRTAFTVE